MTITESDLPLYNDPCDPNAPTPPEPTSPVDRMPEMDTKSKALTVCDMMIQKGIASELDQVEVTSGLTALAAARFMAANGIHDRGRRRVMVRNLVQAFEKRLQLHLRRVGDPGADG
jgi:hypothetical protein